MERDRTDKRILALLEKNARVSAAAIGREIGLSRTAVQDRISRMEADGAIHGYRAIASRDGGITRALIFIEIAERPCDRALKWLASLPGVTAVHSISGEIDAVANVAVPNAAELSTLIDQIGSSPMITRARSQIILKSL